MSQRLQDAVDRLAADLGHAVEVDTPSLEMLVASAQYGAIDTRRVDSILHRTPPPEPIPWLFGHGILDTREPVRIPANSAFDMLARVCVPLRYQGELEGFLWLIDNPPLTDRQISIANAWAEDLAALILGATPKSTLARRIASGDPAAVSEARRRGWLPLDGVLHAHAVLRRRRKVFGG